MRIDLLKNGLIDDLFVEASVVRVTRSGDARFTIDLQGEADLQIEVWTTKKSSLLAEEREPPPEWIGPVAKCDGLVEKLEATSCLLHLEQMDRRSYFLGLSREGDSWGLTFSSPAYVKARVLSNAETERSAIIVRSHEPVVAPPEAVAAGLTSVMAVVLSTHRTGNPDMFIDHELWLACLDAIGNSVGAATTEVFLEPKRRFLERLRPRRKGPLIGAVEQYAARVRADLSTDDWETVLWRHEGTLLAAATAERWYLVGGPPPYHDSYTTSIFVKDSCKEALVDALQMRIVRAGGRVVATLDTAASNPSS